MRFSEPAVWMIPITVATAGSSGEGVASTVLEKVSDQIEVQATPDQWIKLNPGTIGFYRTQYTPELLTRFYPAIRNKSLPPLDRLGLLHDLFALVGVTIFWMRIG